MIFDEAIKSCKEFLKSETKKDKTWEIVRPIDANKLKKAVNVLGEHFSGNNVPGEWYDLIFDEIEEQTTLDYAPVIHAKWELNIRHYFEPDEEAPDLNLYATAKCSHCGCEYRKGKSVVQYSVENPHKYECFGDELPPEWKVNPSGYYDKIFAKWKDKIKEMPDYCEHCGAKMETEYLDKGVESKNEH